MHTNLHKERLPREQANVARKCTDSEPTHNECDHKCLRVRGRFVARSETANASIEPMHTQNQSDRGEKKPGCGSVEKKRKWPDNEEVISRMHIIVDALNDQRGHNM